VLPRPGFPYICPPADSFCVDTDFGAEKAAGRGQTRPATCNGYNVVPREDVKETERGSESNRNQRERVPAAL
jgi:hypothetical protein